MRVLKSAMLACAAAGLTLVPTLSPAFAAAIEVAPVGDGRSVDVAYGDLDLSTAKDQARLARRIDRAVEQVCGAVARAPLAQRQAISACQQDAITAAGLEVKNAVARAEGRVRVAAN
ncbi:UrcA family protein [Sphingomonas changnyeongensis]|uniref:UrcA family protein n=1 Tax=Sphingomonas changnyeongensis TaxID=2698679 RepID=A0A7Z2NWX6_9SPHN|nr:UrcA family protein [Sphingomonas changnyeongensis]QHL90739.1 UrcA family protein [Sphingomonas changnyeongensis]